MGGEALPWVLFNTFVVALLAFDLGVLQRRAHQVKMREALLACGFWIGLALLFNLGVWFRLGPQKALEFLTGYLVEESLSVDNLFVFLIIFSYFRVPPEYQHRVLFWGILGAIVMRALFIFGGVALIHRFHWLIYVLGAFLVFTGVKLALARGAEIEPEKNPVLKIFRRVVPVTENYEGTRFFLHRSGKLWATPLAVVLVVVETTDVIFAADSIPAILAITLDPFIVYTSNIFAILGLRALFFVLSGAMRQFHYLHYGLAFILCFIGVKMLISEFYKIPIVAALGVVGLCLAASVAASMLYPEGKTDQR